MAKPTDSHEHAEGAMTPLYARLPRGPHRLGRGEVAENQRQRMHGAMVEAMAAHGYGGTSVKQVISLAGVSRRAFYEQFSNKQECFLSTLDLLGSRAAERVSAAYRSTEGDVERRMQAALQTLTELIASNPKSAHMALVDAPAVGSAGQSSLTKTLIEFERMLNRSFARTPGAVSLPTAVVRGIVGGLHMMVLARVRLQLGHELPQHTPEMLNWTLAFQSAQANRLGADSRLNGTDSRLHQVGVSSRRTIKAVSGGHGADCLLAGRERAGRGQWIQHTDAQRLRLLESALEMIALEGYGNLSPLRIVDRAGVSIDTFFSLFGDMDGCVLVALANLSEEARAALCMAELGPSETWPLAVRGSLRSLMHYFARHPTHVHMLTTGVYEMGSPGIDLSLELADEIACALTAGAPEGDSGELLRTGIAGAVWHTLYCHAVYQKIEMLPAAADHLTYMVLAPFLGAERAAETLTSERTVLAAESR